MKQIYNRVLIKFSGEALAGSEGTGLDPEMLDSIAEEIKEIYNLKTQIAIVVGAGNFWRGRYGEGMDQTAADYMGMLATVINALALQDTFERHGMPTRVQSAIEMTTVCEKYIQRKAVRHLEKGRIVIFAAGTGNPYFTTDTAASLRALEIGADALLLAKNVDAVYSEDPKDNPQAERFEKLSYDEVLERDLKIMDLTAVTLCKENQIPIEVFGLNNPENLLKVLTGKNIGTHIN